MRTGRAGRSLSMSPDRVGPAARAVAWRPMETKDVRELVAFDEDGPRHEGLLLCAAVERPFWIVKTLGGFRIQARTIDLSRPFEEIRKQMLSILHDPSESASGSNPTEDAGP